MKITREELLKLYGLKPGDVILVKRNGIENWFKVSESGYLIFLTEELGELKEMNGMNPVDLSYISYFNWEYYRKEDLEKLGQKRCDAALCGKCPLNILHHTFEYTKQEQPTLYEVLDKIVHKSNKVYDVLKEQLDEFVEGEII